MPRKTRTVPDSVDIIDLTEESPTNLSLRRPRINVSRDIENIPVEPQDAEAITVVDNFINVSSPTRNVRKSKLSKRDIIELDQTINLDDSTLSNTPTKKPLLTCPICFENLTVENMKAMTTPCGHVYCLICLEKICQTQKKCSICQRSLKLSKCIRLHI